MIESVVRCVRCGAGFGKCDCYSSVTMECTSCGNEKKTDRDESWPSSTVRIEMVCPDCGTGDIAFFNAAGNRISL